VTPDEELAHLRAHCTALQARMTEMVSASRYRRVRAFLVHVGQDAPVSPRVPNDAVVRHRLHLIAEEFFELLDACLDPWMSEPWQLPKLQDRIQAIIATHPVHVDLPEAVDALEDIDYTVEGTRQAFGVFGEPLAADVHRSNMEKTPGGLLPNGKARKPDGWRPPEIKRLLEQQGWRP